MFAHIKHEKRFVLNGSSNDVSLQFSWDSLRPHFRSLAVLCVAFLASLNLLLFFWWPEVLIFSWNNYLAGVLKFHKGGEILMTSFFYTFQCSTICSDLNEKFTSHDCVLRQSLENCVLLNSIKAFLWQCWSKWQKLLSVERFVLKEIFEWISIQKSKATMFKEKVYTDITAFKNFTGFYCNSFNDSKSYIN